jgi:hypothetical protein
MNCSKCGRPLDQGAAFCGNCGQSVMVQTAAYAVVPLQALPPVPGPNYPTPPIAQTSTISSVYGNTPQMPPMAMPPIAAAMPGIGGALPAYAVPILGQQTKELKAAMSIVCGTVGVLASVFIPLIGLILAIAGIVLATTAWLNRKHTISLVGLVVSIVALLVALGSWAYVIAHDQKTAANKTVATAPINTAAPAAASSRIATPCYSINFDEKLNVQNNSGSCNMNAYNGATLSGSTNAYKVYATVATTITTTNFPTVAKAAIEQDIAKSLPSFSITNEQSGAFSGSPAYYVTAEDAQGVEVIEAAALHATTNGDNFFVFVHAVTGGVDDFNLLQAGWKWN